MLKKLFCHNWWAILYFNFKMLPLSQAIRLPFDFYGKVRFVDLSGKILLKSNRLIPGMIKIGSQGSDMFPAMPTVLSIAGTIEIEHTLVLGMGSSLVCKKNGCIHFGKDNILGARNLLFCEKSIYFEDEFLSSWDCQIMDSDTHSVIDRNNQTSSSYISPVHVGRHVWIGNGVIINKGTCLVPDTIVASRSLCNKDYRSQGSYCVLAGSPAKVVSSNKLWQL